MMKSVAAILLSVALAGCASSPLGSRNFETRESGQLMAAELATVVAVREVTLQGDSGMASGSTGALIGGAAGSMLGEGSGKIVGALVGAITGAVIGSATESAVKDTRAVELTLENSKGQSYVLVQALEDKEVFKAGDKVKLVKSGKSTRALPLM